ncbi:MAG: hypothetical protein HS128_00770 [Ideonella sp.]|nr:hypothetical protein [Ideonella sp.]MCC7459496.1 hypothetical protein [Nitrospira sp.]
MENPSSSDRVVVDASIPSSIVDRELGRITASSVFKPSPRHQRMLRHLVERTVAGDTRALKESVLAVELFERSARAYDPARDTIVRVEARRLRQRLKRYYDTEGSGSTVRIELPVGSYVPKLERLEDRRQAGSRRARDLVERGYHFLREGGEEPLRKAVQRFEAAIREDGEHAAAYLGAARAWMNLVAELYESPLPWVDHATEALQRALEFEPLNAEALTLLGSTLHRYRFDWPAASRHLERAIELAPNLAFAHLGHGAHLLLAGEFERAEIELQRARGLDPHYLNTRWQVALLRVAQRRYADARREIESILDLAPTHLPALHMLGALGLFTGRAEVALEHYRHLDAKAPQHPIGLVGVAQALGQLGDSRGVQQALDRLHARFAGLYVSPYQLALIELRRGDHDAVFGLLDEAAVTRDSNTIYALTDPAWDGVRGDARFDAFLARYRFGARGRPADRSPSVKQ